MSKTIKESKNKKEVNSYLTGDNGDIVTMILSFSDHRLTKNVAISINVSFRSATDDISFHTLMQLCH